MVLLSSVRSYKSCQISLLGVLETILSLILSISLVFFWDSWLHVFLSAIFAPVLLLRTNKSVNLGIKYFSNVVIWSDSDNLSVRLVRCFLSIVFFYFAYVLCYPDEWSVLLLTTMMSLVGFIKTEIKINQKLIELFLSNAINIWLILSFIVALYITYKFPTDVNSLVWNIIIWTFEVLIVFALVLVASMMLGMVLLFGSIFIVCNVVGAIILNILNVVFTSLICRVLAIINSMRYSFYYSVNEIPRNWFRTLFCLDTMRPPEIIPGIEETSNNKEFKHIQYLKFSKWMTDENNYLVVGETLPTALLSLLFSFIFNLLFFLPSVMYRFSLKSTGIIWWPLIFLLKTEVPSKSEVLKSDIRLTIITKSEWSKKLVTLSWYCIALLLVFILGNNFLVLNPQLNIGFLSFMLNTTNQVVNNGTIKIAFWIWSSGIFTFSITRIIIYYYADILQIKYKSRRVNNAYAYKNDQSMQYGCLFEGQESRKYELWILSILQRLEKSSVGVVIICGIYILWNMI